MNEIPVTPWEISLKNAVWFIADLPDGMKQLKIIPCQPTPQGMVPAGPAIEILFIADGWERFQRDVAAGERPMPRVIVPAPGQNGHVA